MTNRNLLIALVLAGVAVSGIVLGQSMDGSSSDSVDSDSNEWEIFSGNVVALPSAGGGSTTGTGSTSVEGPLFIYNTRTGKVYRIFTGCGDLGVNGCIEALPVVMEGQFSTVVPQPQSGGNQIRR